MCVVRSYDHQSNAHFETERSGKNGGPRPLDPLRIDSRVPLVLRTNGGIRRSHGSALVTKTDGHVAVDRHCLCHLHFPDS